MARKNIILCGFMGSGKSTIGNLLSKKMGMSFVDMDKYIEKQENKTVTQIFEENGEEYFREKEREASRLLGSKRGLIIAAGGGTLTFPENVEAFRENGRIVLLNVSPETVAERLKSDNTRPLLEKPDKLLAIKELFEARMPLYKSAADIVVDADQSYPSDLCDPAGKNFKKK